MRHRQAMSSSHQIPPATRVPTLLIAGAMMPFDAADAATLMPPRHAAAAIDVAF